MKARVIFLVTSALLCLSAVDVREAHSEPQSSASDPQKIEQGRRLFGLNCAHCHGADATGDEGPDLHGVTKSDAKIATLIKQGVKGEMPKFGQKLSDQDVQALIAFIRSLKE